jgi:PKD repeat protein
VSNSAGTSSATQTITINNTPTALFTFTSSGNTFSFINNSSGATSNSWDFGDGSLISSEFAPTHTYIASGNYTVLLTAFNDCGSNSMTMPVNILLPPSSSFTASSSAGCIPFTAQFENTTLGVGNNYQWTFEGGIPTAYTGENPPPVLYSNTGEFTVLLTTTNTIGSNTSTQTLTTNSSPLATFTTTINADTVQFTHTGLNATSFSWSFGDGFTSDEQNPEHIYGTSGIYNVTLTVSNICGGAVFQDMVNVQIIRVEEFDWLQRIQLLPNPTEEIFQVQIEGLPTNADVKYELIDVLGRVLLSNSDMPVANSSTIWFDASHLPAGMYLCRVTQEARQGVIRALKL